MQAPMFNAFLFDPLALFDDGFIFAEAGIGKRDFVEALVIALMVVMLGEPLNLGLQVAR